MGGNKGAGPVSSAGVAGRAPRGPGLGDGQYCCYSPQSRGSGGLPIHAGPERGTRSGTKRWSPTKEVRAYILNGIRHGFHIGFDQRVTCHPATSNMRSALENAEVIREYLSKEILLGRVIGLVNQEGVPAGTQVSPFGVRPFTRQCCHLYAGSPRGREVSNPYPGGSRGPHSQGATRLDIAALGSSVQRLLQAGLAQSTQRAYASGKRRYLAFCQACGMSPLPATEQKLVKFIGHLANQGIRHQTLKSYLSAARHLQIQCGGGDFRVESIPLLELALEGERSPNHTTCTLSLVGGVKQKCG